MTVFIGDVHGKYSRYKEIIKGEKNTIQVGDMGVGFLRYPHGDPAPNPPYDGMVESGARFIRGNHDSPAVCKKHTQWIKDGMVENNTMFIGGGFSIDYMYRVKDFSWWADEQLSVPELDALLGVYLAATPEIMVTHDCPLF